jgi:hypothetical protein
MKTFFNTDAKWPSGDVMWPWSDAKWPWSEVRRPCSDSEWPWGDVKWPWSEVRRPWSDSEWPWGDVKWSWSDVKWPCWSTLLVTVYVCIVCTLLDLLPPCEHPITVNNNNNNNNNNNVYFVDTCNFNSRYFYLRRILHEYSKCTRIFEKCFRP